ncbi:MAG TPA: alpha/beta fold hydrolase [Verrucomicrobia bacterium]|nr:alpha/beta fold hydrolase [Verrucomicrobiota bacterium]HOP96033.1 alpha/beta fold hydrolase [Verrucomicrobiota bacterium]
MVAPTGQPVCIRSAGAVLKAAFFAAQAARPAPVLIICHGAGEFKEHYFELCEYLSERGVACLAMDMRGHGESDGERYFVRIDDWVHDIRAAIDLLETMPDVDSRRIAAFGLSSGGTAVLEAAILDPRIRALVVLDATVRDSLPVATSASLRTLCAIGHVKRLLGRNDLRVSLRRMAAGLEMAADPDINRRLYSDPRCVDALEQFPFPGGAEAFFVDTLKRVCLIDVPTMVLWGEEDRVDPPETGRMLYEALRCEKELHVIPGNGHAGHVDRNRRQVFELTLQWLSKKLVPMSAGATVVPQVIESDEARALTRTRKWELLSPFLKEYGEEALAYSTLQQGLEYYVDRYGYVAYTTVQHPVFARRPRKIVFSNPVCAEADRPKLLANFLSRFPRAAFTCISERCARDLRAMGFKVNCIGYEVELPIQTYNTQGNWKELDMIKRSRNEARREGITIREERIGSIDPEELSALTKKWMLRKKVNDREIWIYARRLVLEDEEDVRRFVARDREGRLAGFVSYDPMYRDGQVYGYSATILRCDEERFGRLITAIHMVAMETFRAEGRQVMNLNLAPFMKLEQGVFNDDFACRLFFDLSARYGNDIYNFEGLAFHKSKYRGSEKSLYFASNNFWPANDVYLAFLSADITRSYFETVGRLLRGIFAGRRRRDPAGAA